MTARDRVALMAQKLRTYKGLTRALLRVYEGLEITQTEAVTMSFTEALELFCDDLSSLTLEPDHSRTGLFVHHDCYRCDHGKHPCVKGHPSLCLYPKARND